MTKRTDSSSPNPTGYGRGLLGKEVKSKIGSMDSKTSTLVKKFNNKVTNSVQ